MPLDLRNKRGYSFRYYLYRLLPLKLMASAVGGNGYLLAAVKAKDTVAQKAAVLSCTSIFVLRLVFDLSSFAW